MNKQKITLPTKKWGTLKTKYLPESNDVTNDEFTAGSINFITNQKGAIEKRQTDVQYNSTAFASAPKDQFEAVFSNGVHHLLTLDGVDLKFTTGNRTITVAATGFTATASMEYSMYQNRVYMDNGIDNPSVYDITASYGGVTYAVPQVKSMGCQVPVGTPTYNADSAGGSVPAGGHTYKVTFLFYGEEESNGGTASALRTVAGPNFTVNLKTIPVGGYGVTARKIYRDDNDGNYLLVGTISNNTATTFVDTTATGTTEMPAANDLPPIFSYVTLNLSRQFVAGVPGTPSVLYWSTAGLPDIFDPDNFIICNPKDPINGLATFQGITIVLNRHSFGKVLGNTDDTFEYEEVSGSVGCVDNRSIQIRTIDGVPVLVWLSDRGFYKFDGSSVTYISDPIEDIVNFNLQQVSFTTGSNNQSTESDYAAGTLSPSIDITSDPGVLSVLNPEDIFQSKANWEGGSSLNNIATADGSNQLKVPTRFVPTPQQGAFGGSAVVSTDGFNFITLTQGTAQTVPSTGPTSSLIGFGTGTSLPVGVGTQFTFQHNGTLNTATVYIASNGNSSANSYRIRVYSDVLGAPATVLYETTGSYPNTAAAHTVDHITVSPGVAITANQAYWLTIEITAPTVNQMFPAFLIQNFPTQLTSAKILLAGNWVTPSQAGAFGKIIFGTSGQLNQVAVSFPVSFSFTQTPVAVSGTWTSAVYDSASIGSASGVNVKIFSQSSGVGRTVTLFVDASNDPNMSSGVVTVSTVNPSFQYNVATTNKRYWRLRYSLVATSNLNVPSASAPQLYFGTTGTWISPVIDCTTDVTAYDALTSTTNLPGGTTITITVATSTDNITYTSFGPVGSAVVSRYVKVKVVLTTTTDNISTPSVSFLKFSWQQTSTFISSIIDAGQVPTGWGVFQAASATHGGTATFYMRSASTSGGIAAATFFAVSNGVYPPATVVPHEFVQWKVIFTSTADALPEVSGVTINWFIGTAQSPVRAASLFFNKTYYLAAATVGSETNNIVLVWDFENNWRVFEDVTINSLGLFFNEPFYCDAARNNIYQWLISPSGSGSAINMDIRTKAFDLGDVNSLKIPRSLRVTGINTGTTIHAYFSVDRGTTWTEMYNVNGTTGYATPADGKRFSQYFVPFVDEDAEPVISGTTVIYRVTSTDAYPCTIMQLEPVMYSRSGRYLEVPV